MNRLVKSFVFVLLLWSYFCKPISICTVHTVNNNIHVTYNLQAPHCRHIMVKGRKRQNVTFEIQPKENQQLQHKISFILFYFIILVIDNIIKLSVFDHFNVSYRLCLLCAHAQMKIYARSSFYHVRK